MTTTPPALARVRKLTIVRDQGGPTARKCDGVIWRGTIELPAWKYASATCRSNGAADPLVEDGDGTLPPAARTKLEGIYARMAKKPDGCGHDGGAIHLTLDLADNSQVSVVDENWGCRTPAPDMWTNVAELATTLWQEIEAL